MVLRTLRFPSLPTFSAVEDSSANGTSGGNPMVQNRSMLKDFLASIATMTGDLSNITAPPFVLDTKSVVEIPSFWAEDTSIFVSPSTSEDPLQRALLVLKSFLGGMKSQCYMGHTEQEGVKKPLNAFLGELFLAQWEDERNGKTHIVSEQVSHHPPITACRVWNEKHGVVAEGYNRQKITFSWSSMSVNISSTGFALKTIEKYKEAYLLPLPDFKVKGVLSGVPYPEPYGTVYIPSTNGYMSAIHFTGGKGFFGGGTKHEFTAALYKEDEGEKHALYTISGCWNTEFTIRDERSGENIETFNVNRMLGSLPEMHVAPIEEQDPWESRRAWAETIEAIKQGDMKGVTAAKSDLEQGQREMRKNEQKTGTKWQPLFYNNESSHGVVQRLMSKIPDHDFAKISEATDGVWLFDAEAFKQAQKPFHSEINPDNRREGEERKPRSGSVSSRSSISRPSSRASRDFGARSGSLDLGRGSIDSDRFRMGGTPRQSVDMGRPSNLRPEENGVRDKVGAVDTGKAAVVNGTKMDVGQQPRKDPVQGIHKNEPEPQTNQLRSREEELGTGIEGLSVDDKTSVEDMLRSKYASNA